MSIWLKILYVFLAGGLGAVCRLFVKMAVKSPDHLTGLSTLIVNTIGCFLIGVFAGVLMHCHWTIPQKETWALLLMTGFCGGFSTFSAFTLDCVKYIEADKLGTWLLFGGATIFLGLAVCAFGYWLGAKTSL